MKHQKEENIKVSIYELQSMRISWKDEVGQMVLKNEGFRYGIERRIFEK